jgi:DNA-binding HxlR family transcriptional regulator
MHEPPPLRAALSKPGLIAQGTRPPPAFSESNRSSFTPPVSEEIPHSSKIGIAAITENMLKRKWSATILRHLNNGILDPTAITKLEAGLTPKVISERLRTMHRYALVTRVPQPTGLIEYRVTARGKKILHILDTISDIGQQADGEL